MSKPGCYGGWTDSLKCVECVTCIPCVKERERELKYRERQRVNAEAVVEGIETYHLRQRPPKVQFILTPVER